MTAQAETRPVSPSPWVAVGLAFLGLALVFSARASVGVMMTDWEKNLHWSRSFISEGAALALIVMALTAPIAGNLVDRIGPRLLIAGGLVSVAIGMCILSAAPSPLTFLVGYALFGAIGMGLVATHVVSTTMARLFEKRRGLATGIATSGATGGQLLIVPAIQVMLSYGNWEAALFGVAGACLALGVLSYVLLPGGVPGASSQATAARKPLEPLSRRLGSLVKNPVFHLLWGSFFICGFTTTGTIETHFIPYATFCGFPPLPTATAYGVLSAANLAGMVLSGWLTDRMHRPLLLGSIYIVRAFSFLLLMRVGTDLPTLYGFAVLFGLFDYSTVPPTAGLVATRLGLPIMGLAMGLISAGHALGGALGAFMAGYLFDLFTRYSDTWIAAFALALLAGVASYAIRETRRLSSAAPVPA